MVAAISTCKSPCRRRKTMTSTMLRRCLTGAGALAALAAVVALAPATSAEAAPSASSFAGSWSGTWSIEGGPYGTYDWSISDSGAITGTVYSIPADHGGAVVGHVGADGKLKFTGMAPGDTPNKDGSGYPFQGTAFIDGDGKLVASATPAWVTPWGTLVAILERK
jgi:hypothetical protein